MRRGSLTLEAVVIFPFVITIFLSVALFLRVVYTYEVIQNAISSTIREISAYGYLKDKYDPKINDVIEFVLQYVEDSVIDQAAEQLFFNNIHGESKTSIEEKLKKLGITDGTENIDFEFYKIKNDNNMFAIDVNYSISTGVLPKIKIEQSGMGRFWTDGSNSNEQVEDIWSLDNFTRGRKIREIFRANLPFNFPLISSFHRTTGKVVMIKSMDLTAVSYEDPVNVKRRIQTFIKELSDYRGQSIPWGKDKIVIDPVEILDRELILVIPENTLSPETENELTKLSTYALINGIRLKVERYGMKKNEN